MVDSPGWIPTQRTNPQLWIFLAVSLLFILGANYEFATSGLPLVGPVPFWVLTAGVSLLLLLTFELYLFNVRRPRAVRITGTGVEVRTLFGGLLSIPAETARIAGSWPAGFGSLRSPAVRAWISLDPNQFSRIRETTGAGSGPRSTVPLAIEVDPVERLKALIGSTTRIPVDEMRRLPAFRPTPVRGSVAVACLFFVPVFALVLAYTVWLNDSQPGYFGPSWVIWLLVAFGALLVAAMVWFTGVGMTSFGIATSDEGVLVFDRPLGRGIALKRTLSWGSLTDPKLQWGKRVWVDSDVIGTYLTLEQARAVLTDPRCPIRDRLPADVSRALEIG